MDNIIIVLIIVQSTVRDLKIGSLNFKRSNGSAKYDSELFFGVVIGTLWYRSGIHLDPADLATIVIDHDRSLIVYGVTTTLTIPHQSLCRTVGQGWSAQQRQVLCSTSHSAGDGRHEPRTLRHPCLQQSRDRCREFRRRGEAEREIELTFDQFFVYSSENSVLYRLLNTVTHFDPRKNSRIMNVGVASDILVRFK